MKLKSSYLVTILSKADLHGTTLGKTPTFHHADVWRVLLRYL